MYEFCIQFTHNLGPHTTPLICLTCLPGYTFCIHLIWLPFVPNKKAQYQPWRCEQGSNLHGKIPLDFESNALSNSPIRIPISSPSSKFISFDLLNSFEISPRNYSLLFRPMSPFTFIQYLHCKTLPISKNTIPHA